MEINTTITLDRDDLANDLEDFMREAAEEVVNNNDNGFVNDDEVASMIEDAVIDEYTIQDMVETAAQEFIDGSNQDVDSIIEGMRADLAILMHQQEMHELNLYSRSLKGRASRAVAAIRALPGRVHFYSPFMKGR